MMLIQCLEGAGFIFNGRSFTQKKQEVRSFICGHPALMAADYYTMIDKMMYYLAQIEAEKRKKRSKRAKVVYPKPHFGANLIFYT